MAEAAPVTVLLTLGSNIEPAVHIGRAVDRLRREMQVDAVSSVWESDAYGAPSTPRFHNAAVRLVTRLSPEALKRQLRRIEADLGRRRTGDRNAPRTIDLDIALFGSLVIDDPSIGLRIPDPEIRQRAYLALPLAEVAPEVLHPVTGEKLADIAAALATDPDPPRRVVSRPGSASGAGS